MAFSLCALTSNTTSSALLQTAESAQQYAMSTCQQLNRSTTPGRMISQLLDGYNTDQAWVMGLDPPESEWITDVAVSTRNILQKDVPAPLRPRQQLGASGTRVFQLCSALRSSTWSALPTLPAAAHDVSKQSVAKAFVLVSRVHSQIKHLQVAPAIVRLIQLVKNMQDCKLPHTHLTNHKRSSKQKSDQFLIPAVHLPQARPGCSHMLHLSPRPLPQPCGRSLCRAQPAVQETCTCRHLYQCLRW